MCHEVSHNILEYPFFTDFIFDQQAVAARNKIRSANTTTNKENQGTTLNKASSIPDLTGVSKIPLNKFKTPVDRVKRPLRSMNTQ